MRCAQCGAENSAGKRFCGDCGAALVNRCARCGAENPPEKKFCGDCGNALGMDVVAERASRPQREQMAASASHPNGKLRKQSRASARR